MTQIRDIAWLAGVHRSTVSRVLSGRGYASTESREKVMKVVRKLDYHVNSMARALKSKQKTALGFYAFWHYDVNPSEPYYQQTLTGIISGITRTKYHLVLSNVQGFLAEGNKELDFFHDSQLGGVIMMAPRVKRNDLSFLKKLKIPVVLLFFRMEEKEYSWVDLDNIKGSKMAVEHLIGLGHRRIGFIGGDRSHESDAKDRYTGYQAAHKAANLKERPELVQHGYFSFDFGKEGTQKLLSLPENQRPTAIFCATDMTAFGAIQKASELGFKVPKQLSIVGFDDYTQAAHHDPPLTTIRQPFVDFGKVAVEMLESIINDPKHTPKQVMIEPQLIVRKSTAPPLAD